MRVNSGDDASHGTKSNESFQFQPPEPVINRRNPTSNVSVAASTTATTVTHPRQGETQQGEDQKRDIENTSEKRGIGEGSSERHRSSLSSSAEKTCNDPKSARGGLSYKPPSWAPTQAPTDSGYSLTVLKHGVEVNSIPLDNRTHCLLGRQQGVVDMLLEHPSISRQHAVIQHGDKGSLFLFDNRSTHGCVVNKQKIRPNEFHRLNVGDVIKFGESTRLYIVEGPQELLPVEYESDNLRKLRHEAARKQLETKLAKVKAERGGQGAGGGDSGEYGISWGFDEDAVAEDDDEENGDDGDDGEVELPDYLKTEAQKRRRENTKVGLTEEDVHRRDSKLFQKLQLKITKVEHLLTENERITAKEGSQGGLTEGQQAQLKRNDQAIVNIRLQIEELEETIRSKNRAREKGKELAAEEMLKVKGKEEVKEDYEEDDFYDRTKPMGGSSSQSVEQDLASRRAEVKARRFARRDKTNQLHTPAKSGGSRERLEGSASGSSGGAGYPDESSAQSFEALTRRHEIVSGDLSKTEKDLAELDDEEAKREEEEPSSGEESGADPLDAFMAVNRKSATEQARLRLRSQRETLLKEQSRLKVMMDVARPSMPELKVQAPPSASTPRKDDTGPSKSDSAPHTSRKLAAEEGDAGDKVEKMPGKTHEGHGHSGLKLDEKGRSKLQQVEPAGAKATLSTIASAASKHQKPREAAEVGPSSKAAKELRECRDRHLGAEGDNQTPHASGLEVEEGPGPGSGSGSRSGSGMGAERLKKPTEVERVMQSRGKMLPPPPVELPRKGVGNSGVERDEGGERDSTKIEGHKFEGDYHSTKTQDSAKKRRVQGPAAMPPPAAKMARSPQTQNPVRSSKVDAKNLSGTDTLEGGDADWIPPKGQVGDGRTELNAKFGY